MVVHWISISKSLMGKDEHRGEVLNEAEARHFEVFGFTVLRNAFHASALSLELDLAIDNSSWRAFAAERDANTATGRYVPMMCEHTPESIALLAHFTPLAEHILGRAVLPCRAKGVQYQGATSWHRDTELPVRSIGFLAYLEPLTAADGALCVMPGSHDAVFGDALQKFAEDAHLRIDRWPGVALATQPGDVIVMDEHLFHASSGGDLRRQWRSDFIAAPVTRDEEAAARSYFKSMHAPDWDGGYDVDRYPSYGEFWRAGASQDWVVGLERIGALAAAQAEEDAARVRRATALSNAKDEQ